MSLSEFKDDIDIEQTKRENDRIIMKIHGLEYGKFFPQEHQCEK